MYKHLDRLLEAEKKKIRTELNRLSVTGFDELNVSNTRKITREMYDAFLSDNEHLYLKAAKTAYKNAFSAARAAGYSGKESDPDADFIFSVLEAYNLVTGYLYLKEAERKRLRLSEQILTAREYCDGAMYQSCLRKAANLWWTQTSQYGISIVDEATVKAFKDAGVKKVRWIAADDEGACTTCGERDNKVYKLSEIPPKPHYGCRCRIVPIKAEV